jgi:protein TonB
MITPPRDTNVHLASSWTVGLALLFLGIGVEGAMSPLLPEVNTDIARIDIGDEVMVEEFNAPASTPEESPPELEEEAVEEIEIPPLPEIATPLTPPEMVELTPLEPIVEKPAPAVKPPEPKQRTTQRSAAGGKPSTQPRSQGGSPGGNGAPQLFTGGGSGRFPSPFYPASARMAGIQGSVRLLVTVETSGLPSSVSVSSSSGHSILDNAAREHVQSRWRWPAGDVRRYIVPIRFVLQ